MGNSTVTDKKTLTLNVEDNEAFVKAYLTIWNGMLKLTEIEFNILAKFIVKYLELKEKNTPEMVEYFLFSPQGRKDVYESLGLTEANFNNRFKSLKDKGVVSLDENDKYSIHPRVLPYKELVFTFKFKE